MPNEVIAVAETCSYGDACVAIIGQGARNWRQCADILLCEVRSRRAARHAVSAVWSGYPGCMVAVALHYRGRWCVVATRGQGALLVRALRRSIVDSANAELVARVQYGRYVAAVDHQSGNQVSEP